jgi:hypothetical protein
MIDWLICCLRLNEMYIFSNIPAAPAYGVYISQFVVSIIISMIERCC